MNTQQCAAHRELKLRTPRGAQQMHDARVVARIQLVIMLTLSYGMLMVWAYS